MYMLVCPHLSDIMWPIFNQLNLTDMYDLSTTVLDPRQRVPNKTDMTQVLFGSQIITKIQNRKDHLLGEPVARALGAQCSERASLKHFLSGV